MTPVLLIGDLADGVKVMKEGELCEWIAIPAAPAQPIVPIERMLTEEPEMIPFMYLFYRKTTEIMSGAIVYKFYKRSKTPHGLDGAPEGTIFIYLSLVWLTKIKLRDPHTVEDILATIRTMTLLLILTYLIWS